MSPHEFPWGIKQNPPLALQLLGVQLPGVAWKARRLWGDVHTFADVTRSFEIVTGLATLGGGPATFGNVFNLSMLLRCSISSCALLQKE